MVRVAIELHRLPEELEHLTTDEMFEILAGFTLRSEDIEAALNKNK